MKRVEHFKRHVAGLLAVLMLFSCMNVTAFAAEGTGKQVEEDNSAYWTVSTAELVVAANAGTEAAAFIVAATESVIDPGKTHEAELPTDALVSAEVDGTTATVTAEAKDGWIPVSVTTKTAGGTPQPIDSADFADPDADCAYTAEVTVRKNEGFVAEVTYALNITLSGDDLDDEARLVALAANLKDAAERMGEAVDAAEGLAEVADMLSTVAGAIPDGQMTTFAGKIGAVLSASEAMTAVLADYDDAFKAKFHWDNGAAVQAAAADAKEAVDDLYDYILVPDNYEALETMMNLMGMPLDPITEALDGLVNEDTSDDKEPGVLAVVCADDWDEFLSFTPGFTGAEDKELDALVAALSDTDAVAKGVYANVATEVVSRSCGLKEITVTVEGTIGNNGGLLAVPVGEAVAAPGTEPMYGFSTVARVLENADAAMIETEVLNAAKAAAAANWSEYAAAADQFTVVCAADGEDYTVTFTPKSYTVTLEGSGANMYPFGTMIMLSTHDGDGLAWNYTVDGTPVPQGTAVPVTADMMISREADYAEQKETVLKLLALDSQHELSDLEKEILSSDALISAEKEYSWVGAVPTFEVVGENYVITAPTVDGWVAYEAVVEIKNGAPTVYTVVDGTVTFPVDPAVTYTSAVVKYRYAVEENALAYLNAPYDLKYGTDTEVGIVDLSDALADTRTVYTDYGETMTSLDKSQLTTAKFLLSTQEAKDAMGRLLDNGWDSSLNAPKVYSLMADMEALAVKVAVDEAKAEAAKAEQEFDEEQFRAGYVVEKWPLGQSLKQGYYESLQEQIELFVENMGVIVADENFAKMLDAVGQADKEEQINDLCDDLDKRLADFVDLPAGKFNEASGAFVDVINKLDNATTLVKYDDGSKGVCVYNESAVPAEGYKTQKISVSVEVAGKLEPVTVSTELIVAEDDEASQNAIDEKIAELEAKLRGAEYGLLSDNTLGYYNASTNYETGKKVYTLKTYTVRIVDEAGAQVKANYYRYGDDLTVDIPSQKNNDASEVYYKYFIGGEEISTATDKYGFAMSDFGTGSVITITRVAVNKAEEKFNLFIENLDEAVSDMGGSVISAKVDGSDVIVLQVSVDTLNTGALADAAVPMLQAMTDYGFVGVYTNNATSAIISDDGLNPQALVDMLLYSGLSNATLMSAIKTDGTINHMKLDGEDVGGKLMENNFFIGDDFASSAEVPFYVTLVSSGTEKTKDLRSWLDRVDGYVGFAMDDGEVSFDVTVPQSVFTVYLAVQTAIGRFDLETIKDDATLYNEVAELRDMLADTELSAADIEEALDVDLGDYAGLVDKMISVLQNGVEGETIDVDSWNFDIEYDVSSMLGDFEDLFNNIDTELTLPVSVVVNNYGDLAEAEAMVIDLKADDVLDTVVFTDDLAGALAKSGGLMYALLLEDYEGDLAVAGNVVLDLNGKTVNGNITSSGDLTIVSRVINADEAGAVTGTLSGNISLAAGTYTADVDAFVKNGYAPVDGVVVNEYYQLSDDGVTTTVTLNLEALMAPLDQGNLQTLLLDIMSDILLNVELYAAVTVEGHTLYNVDLDIIALLKSALDEDFASVKNELLDTVSVSEVEAAMKAVVSELTDVEKVKSVIKNGGTLATFDYTVAGWSVVPSFGGNDGPEVTIKSGSAQEKQLVVEILPLNDAQKDTVTKLYNAITDIIDVKNRSFTLGEISYVDGDLQWSGNANADVVIDLTQGEDASDYVTVLALILANAETDADKKAELIANTLYYHNGEWSDGLEAYFADVTVGDLVDALDALHTGSVSVDSVKDLIDALLDNSNTVYLETLIGNTPIYDDNKLPGQDAENLTIADLEKIAELEDIYDIVLTMAIKMAEAANAAADKKGLDFDQKLSGLYDGESVNYGKAHMSLTLKLFNEYVFAVDKISAAIDDLEVLLKACEDMDGTDDEAYLEALFDLCATVAAIQKEIDKLSPGAKKMVEALPDYSDLFESADDYVEENTDDLAGYLGTMISEQLSWVNTAWVNEGYTFIDLIDAHYVEDGATTYQYDVDRAEVINIINVYERLVEYDANIDFTGVELSKLDAAKEYFGYWSGSFNTDELGELGRVIDAINTAWAEYDEMAKDDGETEIVTEKMMSAYALYDALGPNAQSYVKAKTEGKLDLMLNDFETFNMLWVTEIDPVTYTGTAIKPEIKVYEGTTLLTEKVDYTVSYKNNVKAFEFDDEDFDETYVQPYNEAKADYDAKNSAYLTAEEAYNAAKDAYDTATQAVKDAQAAMKGLKRGSEEYNAAKADYDEAVKVKADASKAMSAAKSEMSKAKSVMTKAKSALTKAENKLASKAPAVIVTFKKNYTGQAYRYFEIERVDLGTANEKDAEGNVILSIDDSCVADGIRVSAIKPVVMFNNKKVSTNEYLVKVYDLDNPINSYDPETEVFTLTPDSELTAKDVIQSDGNYAVQIVPKNTEKVKSNFCGEYVSLVKNAPLLMSKATIGKIPAQNYADWDKWAKAGVVPYDEDGNVQVMPDMEFDWAPESDLPAVSYVDEIVVTARIGKQTLPLVKGVHYTVSYENNTGAGTAKAIITGTGKALDETMEEYAAYEEAYGQDAVNALDDVSFTGTKTATFKINGIKMTSNMVTFAPKTISKDYTGKDIELTAGAWVMDEETGEYTLTGDQDAGIYGLMRTYKAKNDEGKTVTMYEPMEEDVHYTVSYQNNDKKGTATILFTGIGNYTGTVKKTFKIVAADLITSGEGGIAHEGSVEYTKSGAKPEIVVTFGEEELTLGKDYTVTYRNNKKAIYEESFQAAYEALYGYMNENDEFVPGAGDEYYAALALYEVGEITRTELNKAKSAMTKAQSALQKVAPTFTVTGKGNFTGSICIPFEITPADLDEMTGTAKAVQYRDRVNNYKTSFTLTDADGKKLSTADYDSKNISYWYWGEIEDGFGWSEIDTTEKFAVPMDDADAGYVKMRVVVYGKGNYGGHLTIEYNLYTVAISKAKISRDTKATFVYDSDDQDFVGWSDLELTYNGEPLNMLGAAILDENGDPTGEVIEKNAADYEVVQINESWVLPGTATAEIVGMNEFGGSKKITFRIQKNSAAVSALDDRIHFLPEYDAATAIISSNVSASANSNLTLYTAKPIVLF